MLSKESLEIWGWALMLQLAEASPDLSAWPKHISPAGSAKCTLYLSEETGLPLCSIVNHPIPSLCRCPLLPSESGGGGPVADAGEDSVCLSPRARARRVDTEAILRGWLVMWYSLRANGAADARLVAQYRDMALWKACQLKVKMGKSDFPAIQKR